MHSLRQKRLVLAKDINELMMKILEASGTLVPIQGTGTEQGNSFAYMLTCDLTPDMNCKAVFNIYIWKTNLQSIWMRCVDACFLTCTSWGAGGRVRRFSHHTPLLFFLLLFSSLPANPPNAFTFSYMCVCLIGSCIYAVTKISRNVYRASVDSNIITS